MNKQIDFEKKMAEITADVSNRAKAFKYVQFDCDDPIPNDPVMTKMYAEQKRAYYTYNLYVNNSEINKVMRRGDIFYIHMEDVKAISKSAWLSYVLMCDVSYYENLELCNKKDSRQLLLDAIAKSPEYSFRWAVEGIGGRFDEGEEAIATNAEYSYRYATLCTKGPFKAGEYAIATDPSYSEIYANKVLKADFYIDGVLICKKGRGLKRG